MKLLTLNTHSLEEENYSEKLRAFVSGIYKERPEIIALQEVNQTASQPAVEGEIRSYTPCMENVTIRMDNHVLKTAEMLREMGVEYYWTWLPLKRSYNKYDEGIAVMSRSPIVETDIVLVSNIDDYGNWKTRKLMGIRTEANPDEWFFSVHYGWWSDPEEPFREQWIKTAEHMTKYECVWLMGDFNSPAHVRGEGYDMMKKSHWHDSYELAAAKDSGITVKGAIDGWKDRINVEDGMRIDQIWCSKKAVVTSSRVIFNGINYPVVSDHYGLMINSERSIV